MHANINCLTCTERAHLQWIPKKLSINPSFCCPILDLTFRIMKQPQEQKNEFGRHDGHQKEHFKRVSSYEMHLSMDDTK